MEARHHGDDKVHPEQTHQQAGTFRHGTDKLEAMAGVCLVGHVQHHVPARIEPAGLRHNQRACADGFVSRGMASLQNNPNGWV